jgi:outer membrane immunogenic protein
MRGLVLKALTAATLNLAVAGVAAAADMPAKAPSLAPPVGYNWSGFYLGINGGYGWGGTRQTLVTNTAATIGYGQAGGLVGGTFGIQWQVMTNLVFGFEGDWDYAKINGDLIAPGVCAFTRCFTYLSTFGTARARLGYAWDRWLFYVTGGVPFGKITAGQGFTCIVGLCGTRGLTGWTFGGGVEAFVLPKVSVKAEYLYADFGEQPIYSPGTFIKVPVRPNIVRAGINYHF